MRFSSRNVILLLSAAIFCASAQVNQLPYPENPLYVFQVDEEQAAGTVFGTVRAIDPENDPVEYRIPVNGINSQNFNVNSTSGELSFARTLDREAVAPNNAPLILMVELDDMQSHGLGVPTPVADVRVILQDINDNSPQFQNTPLGTTLAEDQDTEVSIFQVEATDSDLGANQLIQFYLETVDGDVCFGLPTPEPLCAMFSVGLSSGIVELQNPLNYDLPAGRRSHNVVIRAQDFGTIRRSSVETLVIAVTDVNDLNPTFDLSSYFFEVHENQTRGDFVGVVSARDGDEGVNDDIIYSISGGNSLIGGNASFSINSSTGAIQVSVDQLDREEHNTYDLTVLATEANDPSRTDTVIVTIDILDINDNSPFFLAPSYSANVSEGTSTTTQFLTITAQDRDHGVHADFTFSVENLLSNSSLPFSIFHESNSGQGQISVTQPLDFESTQQYIFRVFATEIIGDVPRSGATTVTVNIENDNDNNPMFRNSTYTASLSENVNPGTFVLEVLARDGDLGLFGEVIYSLVSGSPGVDDFNITAEGGVVSSAVRLNYEDQSSYTLQVLATDQDPNVNTRNEDQASLVINVINLNDNPPMFVSAVPRPLVPVVEEQVPSTVYTFVVSDPDGDLNPLTLEITSGNDFGRFDIDGLNLVTMAMLDFDDPMMNTSYSLTVVVNDTRHTDIIVIDLELSDINDNSPVFVNTTFSFSVYEEMAVGSYVGTVFAEDADSGLFGEVTYELLGPGANSFTINETTGEIRTAVILDRETRPQDFDLTVFAIDRDPNPANRNTGQSQVIITTVDRNDNAPIFDETRYSFTVEENTDLVAFSVMATDNDLGTNSDISYSIVSGNTDSTFVIGESSGVLSRNASVFLDHERVDRYTLTVMAVDAGSPLMNTTVEVTIELLDLNDVTPMFSAAMFENSIREDIDSGSIVTQLEAEDSDDNENGQLTYSIVSVSGPGIQGLSGTFTIGETTGTVRTAGVFNRELFQGPYSVEVLVRDGGFPISLNSSTLLLVTVTDANDNSPVFDPDEYSNSIMENLPAGQTVATVTATDADMMNSNNSIIDYSISRVLVGGAMSQVTSFAINSSSGVLTTTTTLDYEAIQSYTITVEAMDRGEPRRSSNVLVLLSVLDTNDQPPEFTEMSYVLSVPEDTPTNTRFTMILAEDGDIAPNNIVTYTASITSPFRMDPDTGDLILTSSLDFEDTQEYMFGINATNEGGGALFVDMADVTVNVMDVNDRAPEFDQSDYSVNFPEGNYTDLNQVVFSQLMASDEDSGQLGNVSFQLLSPDQDSQLWDVRTLTNGRGQLVAIGNLDRERVTSYIVPVLARDGGEPPQTARANVLVTITDVNDNSPMLNRASYSGGVAEEAGPGIVIGTVSATDADEGANGNVTISLSDNTNFDIDSMGRIVTVRSFNYEDPSQRQFNLVVMATDNAPAAQRRTTTASLTVNVSDINDNRPVLPGPALISFSLSEGLAPGELVRDLPATDQDSGSNGEIVYSLSGGDENFAVDSNGRVTIATALDYEDIREYNLTLTAADRGQDQLSATVTMEISVTDVNDNPPMFTRESYSFVVDEGSANDRLVGTLTVVDSDGLVNRDTGFIIGGSDAGSFRLVPQSDPLMVDLLSNIVLDYEAMPSYSVLVSATNTASPGGQDLANVTISLIDLNDNSPEFSMGSYTFSIAEEAPPTTPVGTVVATDADGGLNGQVMYSFAPEVDGNIRSLFSLGGANGVLLLEGGLDFEANSSFTFRVMASDSSPTSPNSTPVSVTVEVQDFNENGPVFDQTSYFGSVNENEGIGTLVSLPSPINATEADGSVEGVAYSIAAGGAGRFMIDEVSGLITTVVMLDREEQDTYILTVQASDTGPVSLSSFTQVEITIGDVNDNSPTFLEPLRFTVREDSTGLVGQLAASDPDAGVNGLVTFSAVNSGPFTVESNGDILVGGALDYEATPSYSIMVTASDSASVGQQISTVQIEIEIIDVNDNAPVFLGAPYSATVRENSDLGVSVITVDAMDDDQDDMPTYSIVSGDLDERFTINPMSGRITTTLNTIDREMPGQQIFTLIVDADDGRGRAAQASVTITVQDDNDHAPQCQATPFSFSEPEANINPVFLESVVAVDDDSGLNSVVRYSIVSGDFDNQFFIIPETGELFAAPGLDFEGTSSYSLGVAAVDQGPDVRLTSTCLVEVTVVDVNDNPPVFLQSLYEATVIENATTGEIVTQVAADDQDSGDNGEFTFQFQTPIREFSVDPDSGVVTVSSSLDAETQPLYTLILVARDQGTMTRIGQTMLRIRVVDINDNAPRFDSSFNTISVREDLPMDSDVVTIEAVDPDSAVLTYAISQGDNELYFKISPSSGLVQTARSLDREAESQFTLTIEASDQDGNTGSTTLQITISDINDQAPMFLEAAYFARVSENSQAGTQVLPVLNDSSTVRITAVDSDEPNTANSQVFYSSGGGAHADMFRVEPLTGIVTVAPGAVLDAEADNILSFTIIASDLATNPLSSSVVLTVEVLDVNDESPRFSQPFGYALVVPENTTSGSVISEAIRAEDNDGGLGGIVRYFLSGATPLLALDWFTLDHLTGDLRLDQSLDRESVPVVTLVITASDQGLPALMSTVTVQLTVSDVNDNAPRFSSQLYSQMVSELADTGSGVLTVTATDPDAGVNAQVTYDLSHPDFTINPGTGEITTTAPLDHETQDSYSLTVQACDEGYPQLCSEVDVAVTVQDFNDEAPVFDLPSYSVDVCYVDALGGTPLVQPVAVDRDSGSNSELSYTLQGDSLMVVDGASGLVSLSRDAAPEDVGPTILVITATDMGTSPQSGSASVIVTVTNCTELSGNFRQPYNYLEIAEGSRQFSPTGSSSFSIPINGSGLVTFNFLEDLGNPLMLISNFVQLKDQSALELLGIGQDPQGLDREVRELYTAVVRGSGPGGLVTHTSITLRVLDVDDNDPVFDRDMYTFSVPENTSAPVTVGSVMASDADSAPVIMYSIASPATGALPFSISSSGLIATTTELDRERLSQYNLTVEASDGSGPPTTADVVVMVTDINDCPPTFPSGEYDFPVMENVAVGTPVGQVEAMDCDSGDNGRLLYSVTSGALSVFSIDGESGVIRTLAALDFEFVESYSLTIQAVDMGSSPLTGYSTVRISVEDFNDCPPVFTPIADPPSIREDQPQGSELVRFSVTDCDSGINGANGTRFTIVAGNSEGLFSLRPESGFLLTAGDLDRETTSSFLLSIMAEDALGGANSLSAVTQLSITVLDVNDNPPQFSERVIFRTLSENEDTNPVFTFTASDEDEGTNSAILYSLQDGFGVFSIEESSGAISLVNTLDRETTPSYNLSVVARDRGENPQSSSLEILVTVRDVNDNAPTILNVTSGITRATVIEGTVPGVPVFVVAAADPDLNTNGEVSFSLEDLSSNLPFEISPTGGVISVSGDLDYEMQNEYTVVVVARDNGFPSRLSSVATLTVDIEDNNDNNPTFTLDNYEGSQDEGTEAGSTILTVIASDADQTGTPSAIVEYSLSGPDSYHFTIDPSTGIISNNIVLDRENQSSFTFTVTANNSQSHTPLTDVAMVTIMVLDVNDERPVFDEVTYNVSLSELTAPGTAITALTIAATDLDAPGSPNSALVYSLERQANNPFSIEPNSGNLSLLNPLDFEDTPSYNLVLVVEDKGSPTTLSSTASLLVVVLDENDVPPQFNLSSSVATVGEGVSSFPYLALDLAYSDEDSLAQHQDSSFQIVSINPESPGLFSVESFPGSESGALFVNSAVDYERVQSYSLVLAVENTANGTGPLCGTMDSCSFRQTTTVEVVVADLNDNEPQFESSSYTGEVSSRASTGTSVLTVEAMDNDLGVDSGAVRYSFDPPAVNFRIDSRTGTVFTMGLINDILSGTVIPLTVVATDNNGVDPINSASAQVQIVVLDDFDRIAFVFDSGVGCVLGNDPVFAEYLRQITGYTIVVENYVEYATDSTALYIIHALDENAQIVDFSLFSESIREHESELFQMFQVCNLTRIISFAEADDPYQYPPLVDTQTVVILVLCLILIVGSAILLVMALTQRYLALTNARHKVLADVFYGGSPGGGSIVENTERENYQLESLELQGKAVNRQNPMFIHPFDNWAGVDTSGVESVEGASSLNRDNPLYESQEIRMEMFADVHTDDEEADDAELLAQAIADSDSSGDEDNAITAI